MGTLEKFQKGFEDLTNKAGQIIKIVKYTKIYDADYDEVESLKASSTIWTSGIILPLTSKTSSSEQILLEQGLIKNDDSKLFVSGNITFTDEGKDIKIQIGSPTGLNYALILPGVENISVQGTNVYKVAYVRALTGSLYGE
jgi:hypothetical protein